VNTAKKFNWIETVENVIWQDLSDLYKIAPLGNKLPNDLKIAFNNSMFVVFVYDNEKLIGAGRALADGVDCSYICDVAIHPEFQGYGLGRSIISRLVELSSNHKKIILYAVPGKEVFYAKLGFHPMNTAMAIFKNNNAAISSGLIREIQFV
jgi:ribosomal protein S18 acetylase RimI-like enzyme